MPADWIIGIGILLLVLVVALVLTAMTRPKEIEMVKTNYVEPSPAKAPSVPMGDFRMIVGDVFMIKGRGVVVTGRVESGSVMVGQRVRLSSADGLETMETTIRGIESYKKQQNTAKTGQHVGLLLKDLSKDEVKQGMLISSVS